MKKTLKLLVLIGLIATFTKVQAQKVETSVSQVISSKAAKGELFEFDNSGSEIKLTYLLKESKKGLELETYSFDKSSLKFKGSNIEMKSKSDFKNNSGKVKGSQLLRVYPTPFGKPKLKLGYIEYSYVKRARIEHFIETKEIVPKGDAGEKMFYVHHRTKLADENKKEVLGQKRLLNVGDVQLVGLIKDETKPLWTSFSSMIINAKDLSYRSVTNFDLEYSYLPIGAENLPNGDIALVLVSYTKQNFPKPEKSKKLMAKFKLAEKYHLKYVQINPSGKIVFQTKIDMEQPASGYTLAVDVIPSENNNDVMIMGSTKPLKILGPPLGHMASAKPMYENEKSIMAPKADRLFIAKIKDGKTIYSKNYEINKFISNPVAANGSSAPSDLAKYVGKWGQLKPIPLSFIEKDGKTMVLFKVGWDKEQIMQLNQSGEIEANYFINAPKGLVININPEVLANSDGNLNYFIYHQPAVKKDASTEDKNKAAAQRTCEVIRINPSNKNIAQPVNITPNGNLDLYNPFFFENPDVIITLGNGRKKEIILTRINLK